MNTARNTLIALLAFLSLGAIGGGGSLIISPKGDILRMPVAMLEHSPFGNFLIPGVILFAVFGLFPILLIIALLKKSRSGVGEKMNAFKDLHWAWTFCLYIGFALIIWIQLQMEFIQMVHWLHTFYTFLALIIIFVTMMPQVRDLYKK